MGPLDCRVPALQVRRPAKLSCLHTCYGDGGRRPLPRHEQWDLRLAIPHIIKTPHFKTYIVWGVRGGIGYTSDGYRVTSAMAPPCAFRCQIPSFALGRCMGGGGRGWHLRQRAARPPPEGVRAV